MSTSRVKMVGVAGGGITGRCLTHLLADCGCPVILFDTEMDRVKRTMHAIEQRLREEVLNGSRREPGAATLMNRIIPSAQLDDLADVDILFETMVMERGDKITLFTHLDGICKESCVFVSNTLGTNFNEIAPVTRRPDRFLGMRYFSPDTLIQELEIVPGLRTSRGAYVLVQNFCTSLSNVPLALSDARRFVPNTLDRTSQ